MPIPAYRAKQSTDTAGTGTIVLNAAGTNARNFSAAFGASARRVFYCIQWASGFEIGYGDFDGGTPGSLTRATVVASSNAGALVTLPAGTKDVFAVFDTSAREVVAISGTSTLALADLGNVINFTGSSAATLNLPAVASVPIGAGFMVWNTGTAALTIDPNGAETVNGAATLALQAGAYVEVLRLSVGWMACVPALPSIGGAISGPLLGPAGTAAAPAYSFSGYPGTGAFNPGPNQYAISSGGVVRFLVDASSFVGINTLTPARQLEVASANNHMRFSTPGDATAYYDFGRDSADGLFFFNGVQPTFVGYKWQINGTERFRIPATGAVTIDGKALQIQRGTEQATTSGTAIDFTSIPAGVRRIILNLNAVSTNGTNRMLLQIGAGSIATSGYSSNAGSIGTAANSTNSAGSVTTGFVLHGYQPTAAQNSTGSITLVNISGNTWICSGILADGTAQTAVHISGGVIALGGVLDRVRLTNVGGTDTFDAGAINIAWEF